MKPSVAVAVTAWVLVDRVLGLAWQDEVNVSMCNWAQSRTNVIRDTIYMDGGDLWWQVGLSDGSYASPEDDGDVEGIMYTLNLGTPFNKSSNLTALFGTLSKTDGMASNNIAPNYVDGVMFANDGEFITYGGLVLETNSSSPPADDVTLEYQAYEYGPARSGWETGFLTEDLPSDITRYITNGAGVSAPSENMGYYFSGMRAADWGPIYDGDGSANTLANTLISVNMTTMGSATWSNDTLPDTVPARANAQLAWIPVGENGLLVAVGGVIDPSSLTVDQGLNASQTNASMEVSPTFMDTVPIYDIANQTWHMQNTTGDIPPQLTLFCSVVALASDRSSFNIYIYGGYNGYNQSDPPSDNVYILSVPQMVWTLAYNGTSDHGRSGHTCIRVYPDQMMVLGGLYENPEICLQGGIVEVFNLNSLEFQDSYSPLVWEEYSVPDVVTAKIGGNGNGSATVQAPSSISSLFATEYTKTIATYYPYSLVTSSANSTANSTSVPATVTTQNNGGLPVWVGPVLGVVLGLIVIAAAIIIYLLWRRRRSSRGRGTGASDAQTTASGIKGFVLRWLYGTAPLDEKGPGIEDIDGATVVSAKTHERHISEAGSVGLIEMEGPGAPVHEMSASVPSPTWSDMHWSQPQVSPPLVSPNIDEMMYFNTALSPTGPVFETGATTSRQAPQYVRQASELSTGDDSNISEIGSSDPGRPSHIRQASDNSVSDANSIPPSQDGTASEVSNREQTVTTATARRDRIHTVHEVDELSALDREAGPLEEDDASRRNRNVTELE